MTVLTDNMTFGTFMAPFHRVGENPTLALERDLELIEWLDDLGFDEAWIGEHHSGGWETIASPEVFIATACRSHPPYSPGHWRRQPALSPPLHGRESHGAPGPPDPGTRHAGRGPRALASDAYMFCIDPERQREMMDESLGVIMQLLDGSEPVTCTPTGFSCGTRRSSSGPTRSQPCRSRWRRCSRPLECSGRQARRLGDLTERASRRDPQHQLEGAVGDC